MTGFMRNDDGTEHCIFLKVEFVCIHSAYMRNEERVFIVYTQFKQTTYNNQRQCFEEWLIINHYNEHSTTVFTF